MKIKQIMLGQLLAVCIALVSKSSEKMQKMGPFWIFLQDSARILAIFLFSTIIIRLDKMQNKKGTVPFYNYIICAITDILGNAFLIYGYSQSASYFVVFIAQLMYPMMIVTAKVLFNRNPEISLLKILAFIVLVTSCFFVNKYNHNESSKNMIKGFVCILLSNSFFIANIVLQSRVVKVIGPFPYLKRVNIASLVLSPIINLAINYQNLPKSFDDVLSFYKLRYHWLGLYTLCISAFYILGTFYIKWNGPVPFNIATLPFSAYFGLLNIFETFKVYVVLAYMICISASLYLLHKELR